MLILSNMSEIFNDKYFLMCISITLIIIVSGMVSVNDKTSLEVSDECGFVFDIKESSKGYVFYFQDTDGSVRKCFFREKPIEDVYFIHGTYSNDKSIFFIDSMSRLNMNLDVNE